MCDHQLENGRAGLLSAEKEGAPVARRRGFLLGGPGSGRLAPPTPQRSRGPVCSRAVALVIPSCRWRVVLLVHGASSRAREGRRRRVVGVSPHGILGVQRLCAGVLVGVGGSLRFRFHLRDACSDHRIQHFANPHAHTRVPELPLSPGALTAFRRAGEFVIYCVCCCLCLPAWPGHEVEHEFPPFSWVPSKGKVQPWLIVNFEQSFHVASRGQHRSTLPPPVFLTLS